MKKKLQFSAGVLQSMRRPSHPFAGPIARQREREDAAPKARKRPSFALPGLPRPAKDLLGLPLIQVDLWTAGGGTVFGGLTALSGAPRAGLGLFLGSLLALLSLYSLKAMTTQVLRGGRTGVWLRHGMQGLRLLVMALLLFLLLKISVSCLLGAVAGYIWFLGVLAVIGVRSAKTPQASDPKSR